MRRFLPLMLFCAAWSGRAETSREVQCGDILERALKDHNPDIRKEAVLALSLAGPHGGIFDKLQTMLDDKDVQVRLAAVASLQDFHNGRSIAAMQKALQDSAPEVAFAAARALFQLRAPAGKQVLMSVLSGETKTSSGFVTSQIRDAMRMMHTPRTMLVTLLKQGIGFVPLPGFGEGVASLQGLLSDPGVSGRATAALLLGKHPDPHVAQALREALLDKDWSVRAAAVHSLALLNHPSLERDFVPLLSDEKQPVRLRAAAACLRLEAIKRRRVAVAHPAPPGAAPK